MSRKTRSIPYSIAPGSGIAANGDIACTEIGGVAYLHVDFTGGKTDQWTQVATGVPAAAAGYSYIQVGTQDFGGYCPAKLRIAGGKLEVRAAAGTFTADTVVSYPTA